MSKLGDNISALSKIPPTRLFNKSTHAELRLPLSTNNETLVLTFKSDMTDAPRGAVGALEFNGSYSVDANGMPVLVPDYPTKQSMQCGQGWLNAEWDFKTVKSEVGEVPVQPGDTACASALIDQDNGPHDHLFPAEASEVSPSF